MIPLNATEAISPAIEHTKALLQPFSLKLWLKLGLVALLAEAGAQFLVPPVGSPHTPVGSSSSGIGSVSGGVGFTTPQLVALFVAIGVVAFLVGLALFYLSSRMQLVLMDIVATARRSSLPCGTERLRGPGAGSASRPSRSSP